MKTITIIFKNISLVFILAMTILLNTAGKSLAQIGAGTAPVNPPTGGFLIDGTLQANTGIGDWVSGTGAGGFVLQNNGTPVNAGTTYHSVDLWGVATDEKFKGGNKGDMNPNNWGWVTANATNKLDINNTIVHFTTNPSNGEVWAILASDRYANSQGACYVDFEFYQDTLYTTPAGGWVSGASAATGGRTVGDFLFTVEFKSSNPAFNVYRWQLISGSNYGYVQYTTFPAGSIYSSGNVGGESVPYPAFGLNTYPSAATFIEAAVNLSQVLGTINACTDLRIKTVLIKAKASPSPSADLDDFVSPIQVHNLTFGNAEAGNAQTNCNQGTYTTFTMAGAAIPSPGYTVQSTTWSIVSYTGSTAPVILTPLSLTSNVQVYGTTATLKLTVVTSNGSNICTVDDDVVLTVLPAVSFGTVSGGDESYCGGSHDPSNITMSAAPSGGSGNFTYQWYYQDGLPACPSGTSAAGWTIISGATGSSYDPPSGLVVSRTYAVMVDATGSPDCGPATWAANCRKISVYAIPGINISAHTNPNCHGESNGSATVTVSGGTEPYTYLWNNNQTGFTATGLSQGTYTVTVTDNHGCTGTAIATITEPNLLIAGISTQTNVNCNGENNGSATVTASGGTTGYSYQWNTTPAQSTAKADNLGFGTYTVTVTDNHGCTAMTTAAILQPVLLTALISAHTDVTSNGGSDGSATVSASGGTTIYSYLWNNGQTATTATGLTAGSYTVTVSDAHNCTATATVEITQPVILCLKAKVFLQGPYDKNTHLMKDNLRVANVIPDTEPYSDYPYSMAFTHCGGGGGETVANHTLVFGVTGPDAIVDWVFVELRDKTDWSKVLYTQAGLLQRDGDVVQADGVSKILWIGLPDNQYYVALRHRNHFGVMTANIQTLTTEGVQVNFTDGSEPEFNWGTSNPDFPGVDYTGLSQVNVESNVRAMWYGDCDNSGRMKYEAPDDDQSIMLTDVLFNNAGNSSLQSGYDFCYGYYAGDVDLSGKVKYEAPYDDRSLILYQILFYPLNSTYQSAFDSFVEQLP
jgi:hypothetical protein